MKKTTLLIALGFILFMSSCKKDTPQQPDNKPTTMEELQVPASFNWKTTSDFSLTLTANANGIVEVNNANGATYQKAYLTAGIPYTMKVVVPSYEKSVKLKFGSQTTVLNLTATSMSVDLP